MNPFFIRLIIGLFFSGWQTGAIGTGIFVPEKGNVKRT
jgi:hypothetical protein